MLKATERKIKKETTHDNAILKDCIAAEKLRHMVTLVWLHGFAFVFCFPKSILSVWVKKTPRRLGVMIPLCQQVLGFHLFVILYHFFQSVSSLKFVCWHGGVIALGQRRKRYCIRYPSNLQYIISMSHLVCE